MSWQLAVTCLALLLVSLTAARNPGLKARVTKKGLTYANTVAIASLGKSIRTIQIPDQSGKFDGIKYKINGIHVVQFNPPTSSIDFVPGQGLKWSASNAFIDIEGNFEYKALFIKGHGSFTSKVSGVSFNLQLNLGDDGTGRLKISAGGCDASIGDVDFKFHGGLAKLFNLFRKNVGKAIKDKLKDVMCPMATKAVNTDAEKRLKNLPMTSTLAKKFLLDYLLTAKPLFTTDYMETYHKGEVFWKADPSAGAPMTAPPMPASSETQSMLYLWLSDYVLDTFFFQAQKYGYLKRNVTSKDLPPSGRGVLNTTCSGVVPMCIGRFIKPIGEKYPNSTVVLRMNSTREPDLKISSSGVTANCSGNIDLYAQVPGQTDTPFLIRLSANMSTNVNVSVGNQMLFASISDVKLSLKAGKSNVGPVDDTFLNFLIDSALKVFIIPKINEAGRQGFPLPVTKEIAFENTKISFAADTVQISTDLKYNPDLESLPDVDKPEVLGPEVPTDMEAILQYHQQTLSMQGSEEDKDQEMFGPLKFQTLLRQANEMNESE